jgi:hypothetical protein
MCEKRLTFIQSWNASYIFLDNLWNYDPKKFAGNGVGLGAFLWFACREFDLDYDWKRSFSSTIRKDWDPRDTVNSEQVFSIVVELIGRNSKKYGFDLEEVMRTLSLMKNHSEDCQTEKKLWEKAILFSFEGKERDWNHPYCFSDWCE